MAEFVARLGTSAGEIVDRTFQAENEEALRRDLDAKGYYVFAVRARGGTGEALRFGRRSRKISNRLFLVFNHELATLLKAGLPVLQGLELLLERMQDPTFQEVMREIYEQVKGGTSLSDAFAAFPQHFPPLYSASLRAGERSGELETVIRRYIAYSRVIEEIRKKVSQAVVYPLVLVSFSLVVIYVLLTYAIPRFATMYSSFNAELPFITRVLVGIAGFFQAYWAVTLVGGVAFLLMLRWWSHTEPGRLRIDGFKLKIPLIGSIYQKFAVSQLSRALGTMLRGGIPAVTALEVAAGAVGNRVISTRSLAVVKNVREGQSLSEALESTEVLQPMVVEMVKVGESTGALAEMLENVADFYDEDISHDLQRMLVLIEPALLITMGSIIAVMLIAMYLPIFNLQRVIN